MKKTKKVTKKFSEEEKLEIILAAKKSGVKVTLEKYDVSPATYSSAPTSMSLRIYGKNAAD
jgi:putative transposase